MARLPKLSISDRMDAVATESYSRGHLGYSQLGDSCVRSLVYDFFWAHKRTVHGKLSRIFSLGDHVEEVIIEALNSINIKHYGGQNRVKGFLGHAGGSIDGIVSNVPDFDEGEELLFEAKSMNHTNFLDVKRKGVQESKPVYYTQMQMYMGRLGLKFGLFVSMDKNTSDIYTEIVPYDEDHYGLMVDREQLVISAQHIEEFPRIGSNPTWFACKFCNSKGVCHGGDVIDSNCRTCEHSRILGGGVWACDLHESLLNLDEQAKGCDQYEQSDMWKINL